VAMFASIEDDDAPLYVLVRGWGSTLRYY